MALTKVWAAMRAWQQLQLCVLGRIATLIKILFSSLLSRG